MSKSTAIVVAAGRGTRLGMAGKILLPLAGRPLLSYSIEAFEAALTVDGIVIVAGPLTLTEIEHLVAASAWRKIQRIVPGGERRQDSVAAGLGVVPADSPIVVIHDGARPFVTANLIDDCVRKADETGAAIAAIPVTDTLKLVESGVIRRTVPREGMWAAQTPQAVRTTLLRDAFARAGEVAFTDEASLLEAHGVPVAIVPASPRNLKITTPDDLALAEAMLGATNPGESR